MNNEIIKAMNRAEKKHPIREWWRKNGYKVMRVILFPLYFGVKGYQKLTAWLNSREMWSEARADEILKYYIPRDSDWDKEDNSFYFFDNGMGWSISHAKKHLKFKDRRFWRLHCSCWCGDSIRDYLIKEFELDGFEKILGNCNGTWTEIQFKMIEK